MPVIVVLWVLLAAFAFSALTQGWIRYVYWRQLQIKSQTALSAKTFAQSLLDQHVLRDVGIVATPDALDDRYDPHAKILYSSRPESTSVAALAVTAHEVGHACQHHENFWALRLRRWLQPVAHLIAAIALVGMVLGWFFGQENAVFTSTMVYLGTVVLLLCALPVELDANHRALKMLTRSARLTNAEMRAARQVLRAAAMTYVGAAFSPVLHSLFWMAKR